MIQIGNTTNQVVRRYADPFGAERDSAAGLPDDSAGGTSGWAGDHGFLDKPADASGLTAVGARLYDPVLGSFVSVDPVMDLSDPQQWNAYAYANNNPVTWSDPTGLLLGPLIDGAYTAPTRGKPGSGGWQVAPNNTGYTGTWSNGGAGKWSKPGTSYTLPVTIRHNNTPSAAEKAQAAKAAQERREQRLLRERKAQEAAAAEAREAAQAEREKKNSWIQDAGSVLGAVSAITGLLAAVLAFTPLAPLAGALGAISLITGAVSATISCASGDAVGCTLGIVGTAFGSLGLAFKGARAIGGLGDCVDASGKVGNQAAIVREADAVGNVGSAVVGFGGMGLAHTAQMGRER
ncbi:RHS repeat-associated core domain-containing protein [Promicromonospora sp. MS192]|uniref:RHS repeat-associated core domain-containing protein n=1 Tax=Promicromonospora sp. MS192 TaxID=3412684 RepID=UPI003C2EC6D9